jgi:cell division protein FtsQ
MSGDFVYDDFDDAEEFRQKYEPSQRIEKGLKRLLVFAAIVLGAEFVWLLGISPCIPLSTREVHGFPGFDGNDVLEYAGIGEKVSFVSLNAKSAEQVLKGHYLVDSARVLKRFPDRVSVYVQPRRAVAMSLAVAKGRHVPIYYDKHGVVFRIGDEKGHVPDTNLPLLSGLIIEEPSLGMRLPAVIGSLLEECENVLMSAPQLLSAVSEIQISRKPSEGFDLLLYPLYYPVRVRLGNNFNEETLRYVLLMLNVFEANRSLPQEIDFRSGIGAYMVKEAFFGE